jgi:hypothetical protein
MALDPSTRIRARLHRSITWWIIPTDTVRLDRMICGFESEGEAREFAERHGYEIEEEKPA